MILNCNQSTQHCHPVWIESLQLNPSSSSLLWWDASLVGMVWLIESQDGGILVLHNVSDVIMPGPVCLIIAPHHGDEGLVFRRGATGASGTGAVILHWLSLMVGSHTPVIPPAEQCTMSILYII